MTVRDPITSDQEYAHDVFCHADQGTDGSGDIDHSRLHNCGNCNKTELGTNVDFFLFFSVECEYLHIRIED